MVSSVNSNLYVSNPHASNVSWNNKEELKPNSKNKKQKTNTAIKVSVGFGLAALAAVGMYIATRGKSKAINPDVMEKVLSNGNKVVVKKATLLTKNGCIPAREIIVYDKLGNGIKSKSKAIAKQMNETTGKKYTTIYQGFYDKGKFVGKNEVNRYYTKDGKLLLKVNASTNNRGYKHVTKQAPVGEYVLKGEKRHLASNALDFDSLAGTSAMAQSTRTNGTIRHTIDTTAEDALDTIKLAQEKGFAPRCGVLELEKL